jgi:hypothetical protein
MNGPSVVVVPSGKVTFTVISIHLSPYCPLAVGGGRLTQKLTRAVCPTPIGFGETLQKEYVGMLNGGDCALAFGISIIEAVIESVKNIAIVIAAILFLAIFILFFPFLILLFLASEEAEKRLFSTQRAYLFVSG